MSNVWTNNAILIKADHLAHRVYTVSRKFPKEERYGVTSQLRRAILSVCLNMIEGYSRFKTKSHIHFLEIAFGSLKEAQYLIHFSFSEKYMSKEDRDELASLCDEVSRMLYSKIKTMKRK